MIEEEAKWLTKGKAKIIIQSERMDLYYKYAEKLINKKAAYVCTCNPDLGSLLSGASVSQARHSGEGWLLSVLWL